MSILNIFPKQKNNMDKPLYKYDNSFDIFAQCEVIDKRTKNKKIIKGYRKNPPPGWNPSIPRFMAIGGLDREYQEKCLDRHFKDGSVNPRKQKLFYTAAIGYGLSDADPHTKLGFNTGPPGWFKSHGAVNRELYTSVSMLPELYQHQDLNHMRL